MIEELLYAFFCFQNLLETHLLYKEYLLHLHIHIHSIPFFDYSLHSATNIERIIPRPEACDFEQFHLFCLQYFVYSCY